MQNLHITVKSGNAANNGNERWCYLL